MVEMTSHERVEMALNLEQPDRIPVGAFAAGIGGKVAGLDTKEYANDGKKMAEGQYILHDDYDFDILFPFSHVGMVAEGWGCKIRYAKGDVAPMIEDYIVKRPEQWENLGFLDFEKSGVPVMVEAIETLRKWLGKEAFILGVMFCPITTATHVRPLRKTLVDLIRNTDLLHKGLEAITESLIEEAKAFEEAGADGIFLAVTRATAEILKQEQYEDVALRYDQKLLRSINVPVIAHACGCEPFIDLILDLPKIKGINWWDRGTENSLSIMKEKYGKKSCLVAGVDQTRTILTGTPNDVENEVKDAIDNASEGGGFIVFTGCELPTNTPLENIRAMSGAVKKYGEYYV